MHVEISVSGRINKSTPSNTNDYYFDENDQLMPGTPPKDTMLQAFSFFSCGQDFNGCFVFDMEDQNDSVECIFLSN